MRSRSRCTWGIPGPGSSAVRGSSARQGSTSNVWTTLARGTGRGRASVTARPMAPRTWSGNHSSGSQRGSPCSIRSDEGITRRPRSASTTRRSRVSSAAARRSSVRTETPRTASSHPRRSRQTALARSSRRRSVGMPMTTRCRAGSAAIAVSTRSRSRWPRSCQCSLPRVGRSVRSVSRVVAASSVSTTDAPRRYAGPLQPVDRMLSSPQACSGQITRRTCHSGSLGRECSAFRW